MSEPTPSSSIAVRPPLALVVLWIDWYAYHLARFEGLLSEPSLRHRVAGVEFVGGIGVHAGLKFREERSADLPVETLMPQASWQAASKVGLSRLVWSHLDRLDPAAVLVPGYYTLPAVAAALWARAHDRTSVLMTESTAFDHARSPWKEAAKSLLLRLLFDVAVCGGQAHRRYLEQLNFPMDRVAGCYDVVDNAALAATATALRSAESRPAEIPELPYFLYVGRLASEKNLSALISAWISYKSAGGTWPLVLVGDGPEAEILRSQAHATSFVSDIHFAGLRGSKDLPAFYAFAGCFVLPSSREPWGLVVNEAMACSLPVIVSSHCGCAEDLVQGGRNGFTFDPASEADLVRCLRHVAEAPAEVRSSMGRESAAIISAYTPQRFGKEIASALGTDSKTLRPRT